VRRTQRVLRASRDELRRLADEHAAVRRVATLVARGIAPEELFVTVVREVRVLLGAEGARLARCRDSETPEIVAVDGEVELKSCANAPVVVEGARWGTLEAGWCEQRAVAPATSARLQQFSDLVATALANAYSRAELTASRARVVAAADAERRRIERNLHDGTQQRLVALALALRVAEAQAAGAPDELRRQIADVAEGLTAAVADLQELSRGIHPTVLARGGLEPALRALARRSSVPVELDADVPGRVAEAVEVAVYYLVSEALTNAAKHASATRVDVQARMSSTTLEVIVSDDGIGGADPTRGTGLLGLLDRVESIGGTLEIGSEPGRGTTLKATLPLSSASGLDDQAPPDEARTPSMPSLP
jgi:signal transduction histidine kinase